MTEPRADRLRFRLHLDDGTVLVDEEVTSDTVEDTANRHGDMAKRYLDLGHAVTLEVTDPDGIIAPVRMRHVP